MKNSAGNTVLYRLVAITEMVEDKNAYGELTNTGTTADLIGMTNRVEFDVVRIRGREYHILTRAL